MNMNYSKTLACLILVPLGVAAFLGAGCATHEASSEPKRAKGHYVTLPPETGSRLPRKVWVADDGTVSDSGSAVQKSGANQLGDLQNKSSVNLKGGN